MGAFDYILKTENYLEELKVVVRHALENRRLREENTYLRREFKKVHGLGSLIGKSTAMQELFKMIEVVSANQQHGSDHRRERNRKGTGRKGHSFEQPPCR